ncbi:unnamed protein product [Rotaria sp. Silwood1]|nr:unnamed protein product [Rotaria sp. Silwood1]
MFSSNNLLSQAKQHGSEFVVKVNHRMLIDKILARYSSDFVVCRELIQNADDAKATSFSFELTCESNDSRKKTLHSNIITEIRAVNNGAIFTQTDWQRVASIAEGNTNIESVGQFGVGFFSVFSFSEEPIIVSGKQCMAFTWRDDESLTTYRCELDSTQQSNLTSIILKMRSKYVLNAEKALTGRDDESYSQSATNGKMTSAAKIGVIPTINLSQMKAYFTKVLSFTSHINEVKMKVNDLTVFQVNKKKKQIVSLTKETSTFNIKSISNMLLLNSFVQTEQTFSIANGPSITLMHIDVNAKLNIDEEFHNQIRRILKKSLPSNVRIQLLYAPSDVVSQLRNISLNDAHLETQILHSLLPLKCHENQIIPSGLVFIGLGTQQTTGLGMHVFSHLVPTVERENLDMQDPHLEKWNKELLSAMGQVVRFIYNQSIFDNDQLNHSLSAQFATFSFQTSVPNNKIGLTLLNGFFASQENVLVPVKQQTLASRLTLSESSKAFLAYSQYIHSFLSLPLVPLEISNNGLFNELKRLQLVQEVNHDVIKRSMKTCILLSNEFIALLRWLCSTEVNNNSNFIESIFSTIRFRDKDKSPIIILEKIKHYDEINPSPLLPLPSSVIPSRIATHISNEDFNKHLSLTPLAFDDLLNFYFLDDQKHLLTDQNKVVHLFNLISKYWNSIQQSQKDRMKQILSQIECIPTQQGMKLPKESYIRSQILSPDLPIIAINVVPNMNPNSKDGVRVNDCRSIQFNNDSDNCVLAEFLKLIGCRTVHVQSFIAHQNTLSNAPKTMSEEDIAALKQTQCFAGTTIQSGNETVGLFRPDELLFSEAAHQLKSNTVHIIFWPDDFHDLNIHHFLCSLGIREAPKLDDLIDMIDEDFKKQRFEHGGSSYIIPPSLEFLAKNVEKHYPKLWKEKTNRRAFIPAQWPANPTARRGQFIIDEVTEDMIYGIQVKLESSLEKLKRSGYPIDRLRINPPKPTDIPVEPKTPVMPIVQQDESGLDAEEHIKSGNPGLKRFGKSKPNTSTVPSSSSYEKSNATTTDSTLDDADYDLLTPETIEETVLQVLQPYNNVEFYTVNNKIENNRTTREPCEALQNINLEIYKDHFHGIPFYTEKNMHITDSMLNRVRQLAIVLSGLASNVFDQPVMMMKLYRDADTNKLPRIGFHYNGSLLFNVRYFERIFAEKFDLQGENTANHDSNMHDIINFYFMKSCHLLVHNVHVNHDVKFIRTLENTVIKLLPAKDSFLELFKFSWDY